ncbi:MAG: Dabb family protein [Actinomycetota bacterium]|nr:Dabb family protein [Actinomycetota bacterium]
MNHIALFKFNEDVTDIQIDAITSGLEGLRSKIDVLEAYQFGRDLGQIEGTWDYGVVATIADPADYPTYRDHPDHVELLENLIKPVVSAVARVQIAG